MNKKFGLLALLMLLSAMMISGCSGGAFTASSWPEVATYQDSLFVAAGSSVYVLDSSDGDELRSFPEKADAKTAFYASPVFVGENMILSGYDNNLYFMAADDDDVDWTFEAKNRFIDSVLVVDEMIYAANADHNLYALDMDGDLVFSFEADSPLWAKPVVFEDTLYQISQKGILYAVDAMTGAAFWQLDLDVSVMSSPVIGEDGMLYLSTMENSVVAVNGVSGTIAWESAMSNWAWASPFYLDSMIYIADSGGDFYAFDAENGKMIWKAVLSSRVLAEPIVMGDAMYIGNEDGEIYAISFDGETEKLKEIDGKIMSTGATDGSLLFFAVIDSEDKVLAIGIDDSGSVKWEFIPSK